MQWSRIKCHFQVSEVPTGGCSCHNILVPFHRTFGPWNISVALSVGFQSLLTSCLSWVGKLIEHFQQKLPFFWSREFFLQFPFLMYYTGLILKMHHSITLVFYSPFHVSSYDYHILRFLFVLCFIFLFSFPQDMIFISIQFWEIVKGMNY